MNTLPRTLVRALPRPSPARVAAAPAPQQLRHESSTRRLTKLLRLPPHESFKFTPASPKTSHIIYNPPAASPSVYATPALFMPKSDPRRALFKAETKDNKDLPPPLSEPYEKKYHLTPEDFGEIRRLRRSDPNVWTRPKLAEKFGTSPFFVGMVCQADAKRKKEMEGRLATIKSRWGPRKTEARLDRKRRRAGWGGADGQ